MSKRVISTAESLINNAKFQLSVYKITSSYTKDMSVIIASLVNLFLSLELSLKTYLAYLNDKWTDHEQLKSLGHDFNKIKLNLEKESRYQLSSMKIRIDELYKKHDVLKNNQRMDLIIRYPRINERFLWSANMTKDIVTVVEEIDNLIKTDRS